MPNDPTDELTIPTSLPCPQWCQLPAGHGFEDEDGGELQRGHVAVIGDFAFIGSESSMLGVLVQVLSIENAPEPDGPPSLTPAAIYVDEAEGLTGPQARQVAAALLNAADVWDAAQS